MPTLLSIVSLILLLSVSHGRVTFTYSEVLQDTDLDENYKVQFKCKNGCLLYSDSRSAEMFVTDGGTTDVANFLLFGTSDVSIGFDLMPWPSYTLEYRGKEKPPRFVFYAVDSKAADCETSVLVANSQTGYVENPKNFKAFTLLRSFDPALFVTFEGKFEEGFPRIYATGYDAANEADCKAVYTARSEESAINSWITVDSPILTVVNGPLTAQAKVMTNASSDLRYDGRWMAAQHGCDHSLRCIVQAPLLLLSLVVLSDQECCWKPDGRLVIPVSCQSDDCNFFCCNCHSCPWNRKRSSTSEGKDAKSVFDLIDENKDGLISEEEGRKFLGENVPANCRRGGRTHDHRIRTPGTQPLRHLAYIATSPTLNNCGRSHCANESGQKICKCDEYPVMKFFLLFAIVFSLMVTSQAVTCDMMDAGWQLSMGATTACAASCKLHYNCGRSHCANKSGQKICKCDC